MIRQVKWTKGHFYMERGRWIYAFASSYGVGATYWQAYHNWSLGRHT